MGDNIGATKITTTSSTSTIKSTVLDVNELSSSLQHFGWPDYLVFIIMLIVCAGIGVYFGFIEQNKKRNLKKLHQQHQNNYNNNNNSSNNNKKYTCGQTKIGINEGRRGSEALALDYLVGGRKMKVFPVSMSLVASYVSGISLLGTSTEIYVYGTQYAFILIAVALSSIVTWHIFLPVFHSLQITSSYEYLEMRFDKRVRMYGSVLFTIGTIFWLPIVIYVPALAFNQVTGINIHIVTPLVCAVCIFYTCVGGLKAVVWTDVIQSFVMLGSIILVMVKGTLDLGGLGVVLSRNAESGRLEAPEFTFDPTVRLSVWSVFLGGLLVWVQSSAGNQVMMQRFLAVPTLKHARQSLIIFTLGVMILLGCCMYNGLLIYATYHTCDPLSTKLAKAKDQLVPLLVMDILGKFPGLPGLFVAGVFSAALSSLSTGLNSLAAVILEDFLKPNLRRPLSTKQTSFIMRLIVVLCGILCVSLVFVVEKLGMVLQLSMTLGSITCGPLFGVFIIGLCIPWINGKSALTGGICSFGIMGWICINAQTAIATGELIFPTKPVSTEGCEYTFNQTIKASMNSTLPLNHTVGKSIYHMSFLWYTTCGTLLSIIISGIASFIFGTLDPADMDQSLIAPIIRKCIKTRKYLSVQPDIKERETIIRAYCPKDTECECK